MIFQKIICPLDFSSASYRGLQQAIVLAAPGETELCILYVNESHASLQNGWPEASSLPSEAERCALAIARLCTALEERVPKDLRSRPLLRKGDVVSEVLQVAIEEEADLIALSAYGAGCLTRERGPMNYVLGSAVQAILRAAPCPVVVVNANGPEIGMAAKIVGSAALLPIQSLPNATL